MLLFSPRGDENPSVTEHVFDGPELVDKIAVSVALAGGVNIIGTRPRIRRNLLFPINDTIPPIQFGTRWSSHAGEELVSHEKNKEDGGKWEAWIYNSLVAKKLLGGGTRKWDEFVARVV